MSTLHISELSLLELVEEPPEAEALLKKITLARENVQRCRAYAALPPEERYGWKPPDESKPAKRCSPARRAKQAARAKAFFEAKDQQNAGFSRVA